MPSKVLFVGKKTRRPFGHLGAKIVIVGSKSHHFCAQLSHCLSIYQSRIRGITPTDFLKEGPREQAFKGSRGHAPSGFFLDFNSLKFPFRGFWFIEGASNARKLEKESIFSHHFSDFNLESYIIIANMFIIKNLIDFRKHGGWPV